MENSELIISRDELKKFLLKTDAIISFIKSDGTERVMKATLQAEKVVPYEKKTDRVKKPNPDVLAVWDLDAGSWRSVNVTRITNVVLQLGTADADL